jgi:hypothetical protein
MALSNDRYRRLGCTAACGRIPSLGGAEDLGKTQVRTGNRLCRKCAVALDRASGQSAAQSRGSVGLAPRSTLMKTTALILTVQFCALLIRWSQVRILHALPVNQGVGDEPALFSAEDRRSASGPASAAVHPGRRPVSPAPRHRHFAAPFSVVRYPCLRRPTPGISAAARVGEIT